ncbi:MAG: hypothetical protein U9N14_00810 [Pseudomonadota bacterium]|nr:hypothetical protein [Pseudomonadota bacterium]
MTSLSRRINDRLKHTEKDAYASVALGIMDLLSTPLLNGLADDTKLGLLFFLKTEADSPAWTDRHLDAQHRLYGALAYSKRIYAFDRKWLLSATVALSQDEDFIAANEKWDLTDRPNHSILKDTQRQQYLQAIVDVHSDALGMESPIVICHHSPIKKMKQHGSLAVHDSTDNTINVTLRKKDGEILPFLDILEIILHENTHNHQEQLVDMLEVGTMTQKSIAYKATLAFQANIRGKDSYLSCGDAASGKGNVVAYMVQPMEYHAITSANYMIDCLTDTDFFWAEYAKFEQKANNYKAGAEKRRDKRNGLDLAP